MAVADVARAIDAHYSQVHGIMRKMQDQTGTSPAPRKTRTATKPKPKPKKAEARVTWGERAGDEDAGECGKCSYAIVSREVFYSGKSYGRALIHRNVGDNPTANKRINRCAAVREGDEDSQRPGWDTEAE